MSEACTNYLPVLLVDDDETCCSMMALTLREARVKNVHSLSDGRQVLPYLKKTWRLTGSPGSGHAAPVGA